MNTLLADAGTDKSRALSATIWLKDIASDFKAMNAVYSEWLDPDNKPARATVQSPMARPAVLARVLPQGGVGTLQQQADACMMLLRVDYASTFAHTHHVRYAPKFSRGGQCAAVLLLTSTASSARPS